jgi:hypothetical protein
VGLKYAVAEQSLPAKPDPNTRSWVHHSAFEVPGMDALLAGMLGPMTTGSASRSTSSIRTALVWR